MHSLSQCQVLVPTYELETKSWIKSLDKILWLVYELGSLIFWKLTAGDTTTLVFGYKLCTAMELSPFLKSSGFKPNCRYLAYTAVHPGSWKLSNGFGMLNYTSQWSLYWNTMALTSLTVSFRHFILSIVTLQFIKFWPNLSIKIKGLICWSIRIESESSTSI